MTQMSASQARVVDVPLTNAARGYQNAQLVYPTLFPVVPVDQRGGKIITFGKESFRIYNTGRSPGQNTKRIQIGYLGSPFVLEQHSLEGVLPMEIKDEAESATPGIQLAAGTVATVQDIIQLRTEYAAAALATNLANYGASNKIALSGTDKWTDPASKPSKDIETGKDAIRAQTGRRPNKAVISAKVFAALKNNPSIIDRIKYTGRDAVTVELLAALWGLAQVVVGDAIYEAADGTLTDVWGSDVVLGYTEVGTTADRGRPSYGYTYRLQGYPVVEQPYYDRPTKSWIYPVTDELQPVIAGSEAGYLIKGAV
jgi:hypothetical protein